MVGAGSNGGDTLMQGWDGDLAVVVVAPGNKFTGCGQRQRMVATGSDGRNMFKLMRDGALAFCGMAPGDDHAIRFESEAMRKSGADGNHMIESGWDSGLAVVVAGASTAQAAPAPSSAVTTLSDGRVRVRLGKVPSLRQVGGVATIGIVRGVPTAVVRVSNTRYRAIDLRCTHQGVPVNQGGPGWSCPAHGSQFKANGDVVRGPAEANLAIMKSRWVPKNSTLIVG